MSSYNQAVCLPHSQTPHSHRAANTMHSTNQQPNKDVILEQVILIQMDIYNWWQFCKLMSSKSLPHNDLYTLYCYSNFRICVGEYDFQNMNKSLFFWLCFAF